MWLERLVVTLSTITTISSIEIITLPVYDKLTITKVVILTVKDIFVREITILIKNQSKWVEN